MESITPETVVSGDAGSHASHPTGAPCCSECASKKMLVEQYVYAIGRIDVRFPSIGIEREFQQRERALHDLPKQPRNARVRAVLEKNPHLALRVGYLLAVGNTPAFALNPSGGGLRESLFTALSHSHEPDHFCVVIGRTGSPASPANYGGLLLPTVAVDQIYTFRGAEWFDELSHAARPVIESRRVDAEHFKAVSQGLFRDVVAMPENLGVSDGHRALNYLLLQHPGMTLAVAERPNHALDRIDTRLFIASGGRRQVAVILHFLDRATGVPERVYTTVDVTEEWPFIASSEGAGAPLGFAPYLESTLHAMM